MCDIADDASDLEMLNVEIALANRPSPEPRSPICRNGDCGGTFPRWMQLLLARVQARP